MQYNRRQHKNLVDIMQEKRVLFLLAILPMPVYNSYVRYTEK